MPTDSWVNLRINHVMSLMDLTYLPHLRVSPDQTSVTSLGDEATKGSPSIESARLE